jgi:hypothetical protein
MLQPTIPKAQTNGRARLYIFNTYCVVETSSAFETHNSLETHYAFKTM